ncbi:hypothetical protein V8E51_002322 [Hyaloscypha variabilis]
MALKDAVAICSTLAAPISKLSADHFSILVKFLEEKDIQSARLAGRHLHFFLSPYLFTAVRFLPHQERLNTLQAISQNDVFCRSVRTLRFDASLHQPPLKWRKQADFDLSM